MFAVIRKKSRTKKSKHFLRKIEFLGHIVSDKGMQPAVKKVQEMKNLMDPENKRDVMRIQGNLRFYSTFIKVLHVYSKPLYELLRNEFPFKWSEQHGKLIQDVKDQISAEAILAVPYPQVLVSDLSWYRGFQVGTYTFIQFSSVHKI